MEFHITHTPYQVKLDFKDSQIKSMFDKLVNKYGLRRDQAEKALSMHPPAWIKQQMYMISRQKGKSSSLQMLVLLQLK
jgi:tRNA/tmRNA/rRNA uracil-C5-methylase (TrmA/RlmC/RlmD family)